MLIQGLYPWMHPPVAQSGHTEICLWILAKQRQGKGAIWCGRCVLVNSIRKQVAALQEVSKLRTTERSAFVAVMDTDISKQEKEAYCTRRKTFRRRNCSFCSVFTLASIQHHWASVCWGSPHIRHCVFWEINKKKCHRREGRVILQGRDNANGHDAS